jgi:hypothetical protein
MKKLIVSVAVVLLLLPVISYRESKTMAEGKKDATYNKVKSLTDGRRGTPEPVNQQTSELSFNERVAEKGPVQKQCTQYYYISIQLHGPANIKGFKRNADGTRGAELPIWVSRYTPTPPLKDPIKKMTLRDCYGDTEIEFTGTAEAVAPNDHYWWKATVEKSDGTSTPPQKIGSKENPISIKPGEVHKAIVTSEGGEIRPLFPGGSRN